MHCTWQTPNNLQETLIQRTTNLCSTSGRGELWVYFILLHSTTKIGKGEKYQCSQSQGKRPARTNLNSTNDDRDHLHGHPTYKEWHLQGRSGMHGHIQRHPILEDTFVHILWQRLWYGTQLRDWLRGRTIILSTHSMVLSRQGPLHYENPKNSTQKVLLQGSPKRDLVSGTAPTPCIIRI